ncbi:unnamed protein product, partial [Iphiclides podalirius]
MGLKLTHPPHKAQNCVLRRTPTKPLFQSEECTNPLGTRAIVDIDRLETVKSSSRSGVKFFFVENRRRCRSGGGRIHDCQCQRHISVVCDGVCARVCVRAWYGLRERRHSPRPVIGRLRWRRAESAFRSSLSLAAAVT